MMDDDFDDDEDDNDENVEGCFYDVSPFGCWWTAQFPPHSASNTNPPSKTRFISSPSPSNRSVVHVIGIG